MHDCVCLCLFFSRYAGVHFSMPTLNLALLLTHFLVNVLWQCFFEVSIFVAAYCSLEMHTPPHIHPLCWLFQRNFGFCRLLRIQKLAQRESKREKRSPLIYIHWIRFPVDFYCQQNSDVRRFLLTCVSVHCI